MLVSILYALRWDAENGTHNLGGLLLARVSYMKKYNNAFPWPTKRPVIYSSTLDKTEQDVVRANGEATHKAK